MAFLNWNAFVPGINDLVRGNEKFGVMSGPEKISRGRMAIEKLTAYKEARKSGHSAKADSLKTEIMNPDFQKNYFSYFGYGYISDPHTLVPSVAFSFYSFHIMVVLGLYFIFFFLMALYYTLKGRIHKKRTFLHLAIWTIPLAYIASQAGWVLTEVGRQPWVIQDLMPTMAAVTKISTGAVQVTFWLFAIIFTTLLIAEIKIMMRQIKIGPKQEKGLSDV